MYEIRKLEKSDLKFLNTLRNECSNEYLHDPNKYSLEETIEWFQKSKPIFYLIESDKTPIGYFRTSNIDPISNSMYIGCDIVKNLRGQGLGFFLYKKFLPFFFEEYNLKHINLEVLSTNSRAIRLYKKLGFESVKEKFKEVDRNGEKVVSEFYTLDKSKLLLISE